MMSAQCMPHQADTFVHRFQTNPVARIENTARELARQPWEVDAIEQLIVFASPGPFRGAGAYWAGLWGVSRRTADRLIHRLIDQGLFKLEEAGDRNNPRRLSLIRTPENQEQSNDAHKVLRDTSQGKLNSSSPSKGGEEVTPSLERGESRPASDRIESMSMRGRTLNLTINRALRPMESIMPDSITHRIADVWGLHRKWADQRADEWNKTLGRYRRSLVNTILNDLVKSGAKLPTLPYLVNRCEDMIADEASTTPKPDDGEVKYIGRLDGSKADYNAIGLWKQTLVDLSMDGHSLSVDIWLKNMNMEVSEDTLWLDVSGESREARRVIGDLLTVGYCVYDEVGDQLATMRCPFTLATLQERMGGLAIGIKTRAV